MPLTSVTVRATLDPTVILSASADVPPPPPLNEIGQSKTFVFEVIVPVFPEDGANVQVFTPALRVIAEFKVKLRYIEITVLPTVPV